MTSPHFREALLKLNGGASVEAELNTLNDLVKSEQRRARRLTGWTIAVWAVWFAMLTVSIGVPIVSYRLAQRTAPPGAPGGATTAPTSMPDLPPRPLHDSRALASFKAFVGLLLLAGFLSLPVVGVVLLVLMVISRRSASMTQIRASVASLDAQLRLIAMSQKPPPGQ